MDCSVGSLVDMLVSLLMLLVGWLFCLFMVSLLRVGWFISWLVYIQCISVMFVNELGCDLLFVNPIRNNDNAESLLAGLFI